MAWWCMAWLAIHVLCKTAWPYDPVKVEVGPESCHILPTHDMDENVVGVVAPKKVTLVSWTSAYNHLKIRNMIHKNYTKRHTLYILAHNSSKDPASQVLESCNTVQPCKVITTSSPVTATDDDVKAMLYLPHTATATATVSRPLAVFASALALDGQVSHG